MFSFALKDLKYRFWRTNIYSADLLIAMASVFLGIAVWQFAPESNTALLPISEYIDGNQSLLALFLLSVGFMQLFHIHCCFERRRVARFMHSFSIFVSFAVWLTFAVTSFFSTTSVPIQTAAYASLCAASLWVFIRYGACR